MRLRSLPIEPVLSMLLLSACALSSPSSDTPKTPKPLMQVSTGTAIVSENEKTPTTTDSLEVSHATGANIVPLLTASGTILLGNASNKHRLTVFLDEDCVYCRQFILTTLPLITHTFIDTGRLTLERVFAPMTEEGTVKAKLALCAAAQGKFSEADHWLVTHGTTIDEKQFASVLGLKLPQLSLCLKGKDLLAENLKRAREANIERVPSFVLGKDSWLGLLDREELMRRIEEGLTR